MIYDQLQLEEIEAAFARLNEALGYPAVYGAYPMTPGSCMIDVAIKRIKDAKRCVPGKITELPAIAADTGIHLPPTQHGYEVTISKIGDRSTTVIVPYEPDEKTAAEEVVQYLRLGGTLEGALDLIKFNCS